MKKRKNKIEKLAIGVFVDGLTLQIAALCKQKGKVKLIDANMVNLVSRLETTAVKEPAFIEDFIGEEQAQDAPIDLTSEIEKDIQEEDISIAEPVTEEFSDNASILSSELSTYVHRKFKLGISVSEPEIYYALFTTDWGLKGDDLKRRIIENLAVEKQFALDLNPQDVQIIEVANKDILAVVRGTEFHLVNLLDQSRHQLGNKATRISFIESAEISLVNLVKKNYKFELNEISVIVYIGHEYSRLTFLLGDELLGISQFIGEGIDSVDISHTIYSRLLLELDNLNLKKMDNIILCGEAQETDVLLFLRDKFSTDVDVDYLNFNNMEANGIDPILSRFAIPIGVAWRALEEKDQDLYLIDLVPKAVRERQKIFKLGVWGWLLLLFLPILTFSATMRIAALDKRLTDLESEYATKQDHLRALQEPKQQLEELKLKLASYEKIMNQLDPLLLGTKTWSNFLTRVANTARYVGGIWITDIRSGSEDRVSLAGYSLYRHKIPQFSNMLGNSVLNKVEVQEIRERTVYNFQLEVQLEQK